MRRTSLLIIAAMFGALAAERPAMAGPNDLPCHIEANAYLVIAAVFNPRDSIAWTVTYGNGEKRAGSQTVQNAVRDLKISVPSFYWHRRLVRPTTCVAVLTTFKPVYGDPNGPRPARTGVNPE
jgi:hypothetical protein